MENVITDIYRISYSKEEKFYHFYDRSDKIILSISESIAERFYAFIDRNKASDELIDDVRRLEEYRTKLEQAEKVSDSFFYRKQQVFIYLPAMDVSLIEAEELANECGNFMESLGYELESESEPVFGSFMQKLLFRLKDGKKKTTRELVNDLTKARKALELKYFELPTAEQTEKLANSAAKIVELLSKQEKGIVRLGSLLVLKKPVNGKGEIFVLQLNLDLIQIFDKSPEILLDLQKLDELLFPLEKQARKIAEKE